jgi:hypothetical protein
MLVSRRQIRCETDTRIDYRRQAGPMSSFYGGARETSSHRTRRVEPLRPGWTIKV